ncbi:MAG: hypothetical protein AMK69_11410 [Nitrospira bacterium SG8_3]|nr:MAG: hypothetical protein AMK69_11410 [Nitrospira bacterium SG8_3]
MKRIFLSTWVLVLALLFLIWQGNTLLFAAERMMEKGVTTKEKMETGNTMKKEGGMMTEQDTMKKETGMMKEQDTMKKETKMMKEQDMMKKDTGMMKEDRQ